jgi:hypothetical protein
MNPVMVDQREKAISPFNVMSYRRNRAWRIEKRAGIASAATANLYVEKAPVPASRFTGISALRSRKPRRRDEDRKSSKLRTESWNE